jgi:hypothetical protein
MALRMGEGMTSSFETLAALAPQDEVILIDLILRSAPARRASRRM